MEEPLDYPRERLWNQESVSWTLFPKNVSNDSLNIAMELGKHRGDQKIGRKPGIGVAVVSKSAIEAELLSKKLRFSVLDGYQFERRLTR